MSDRPDASNGKRHVFWGTLHVCPCCGRCLCFGCHPDGPCLDEGQPDRAVVVCASHGASAVTARA